MYLNLFRVLSRCVALACLFLMILGFVAPLGAQPLFNKTVSPVLYAGPPSNTLYANSNGLFRSRDAGQTWVAIHLTEPGVLQPVLTDLLVHPNDSRIVYAVSRDPGRVWKTTNSGDSWTAVSSGLPSNVPTLVDMAIMEHNPEHVYVRSDAAIYVTRNGGAQWSLLYTLDAPIGFGGTYGLAASPSMAGRLYAWTGGNLIRSDDDGATWRSLSFLRRGESSAILDAAVHPRRPDELVMSVNYFVGPALLSAATLVTTDGGASFAERSIQATSARFEIDFDGVYHYNGCCGDYCRSSDQARSWRCTALGAGPRDWSFDRANPSTIYYGEATGVSKSTDAGATRTLVGGTARPTLEKPSPAPRLALAQGTVGTFTLPVESVEHSDWRMPFTITNVPAWLQLNATSGETPRSVTATIDTANLALGVHTAELTLASPHAAVDTKLTLTVVVTAQAGAPVYTSEVIGGGGTNAAVGYSGPGQQVIFVPSRIAVDGTGSVYVATSQYSVHRIDAQGQITHLAGTGVNGGTGDGGQAVNAQIGTLAGIGVSGSDVYLAQISPATVRKVSGGSISTAITVQQLTAVEAFGAGKLRPGPDGSLIWTNSSGIFQYSPAASRIDRRLTSTAIGGTYTDVAVAPGGGFYVLSNATHQVFLVRSNAARVLVAGSGLRGFAGDGGAATDALLNFPSGIAVGPDGTLFIADSGNNRIRAVTTEGIIRTYAGDGRFTGAPTGSLATQMPFEGIRDIAVTGTGDLIVADNSRIYRLTRSRIVPAIAPGGLLHQSTGRPVLAPGGYFSIYGSNLAVSDRPAGVAPLPTQLNGVQVRINGQLAPLFYAGTGQVNGQVPYETPTGQVTATVTSEGVTTNSVVAEVRRAAPGILTYGANRAVAVNPDGGINGANGGAAPGESLVIYATAIGPVDNQPPTGALATGDPLPRARSNFKITVGDKEAVVAYLGLTPGQVGLAQANIVIPDLAPGDYAVVITVDGVESNAPLLQVK